MNYESLTKKELILLAKRAEMTIRDSLEIASSKNDDNCKNAMIAGTLNHYVNKVVKEEERERE